MPNSDGAASPMNNPQLAPEAEALAVCPFCGGAPIIDGPDPRTHICVACLHCGARGLKVVAARGGSREEAITAWNRRASGSTGAVAPEPVAYRYRAFYDGRTEYCSTAQWQLADELFRQNHAEAEPLYAAPADTGQGGRVEELEAALRFYRDAWKMRVGKYGIEWRETPELLEDCGNRARAALDAGART